MSAIRLHLVVEGQTEEAFARRVLAPHLMAQEVWVDARCVYTSRKRSRWWRGGMTSFSRAQRDILRWMAQDQGEDARFSTMFDVYRLPRDFSGMDGSVEQDHHEFVKRLESALAGAIRSERDDGRFIPYLELHEFEALLLSKPAAFKSAYPGSCTDRTVAEFEGLLSGVDSPEEIDLDHPPSKRIMELVPDYDKVAAIALLAHAIPIEVMRARCPHFDAWLTGLEALG